MKLNSIRFVLNWLALFLSILFLASCQKKETDTKLFTEVAQQEFDSVISLMHTKAQISDMNEFMAKTDNGKILHFFLSEMEKNYKLSEFEDVQFYDANGISFHYLVRLHDTAPDHVKEHFKAQGSYLSLSIAPTNSSLDIGTLQVIETKEYEEVEEASQETLDLVASLLKKMEDEK